MRERPASYGHALAAAAKQATAHRESKTPFRKAAQRSEKALVRSRRRIEGGFSRRDEHPPFLEIISKFPSRCASCRTRLRKGTRVRYWVSAKALTCTRCTLEPTRT